MNQHSSDTPDIEGAILLLDNPDSQIRQFIAYLLGQSGDERAVEPLMQRLYDEHVGVRGAAANALGQLGAARAVPYLLPMLADPHPQLVVWAAFALTRLGGDYFEMLVKSLEADEVEVRRSAVLALRQLGDPRAIEPLLRLRGDQSRRFDNDTTVEWAVEKALESLGYRD